MGLGLLGGLIGLISSRGRRPRIALGVLYTTMVLGLVADGVGVIALAQHQPYGVYFPLFAAGLMASLFPLTVIPNIRRRLREHELRLMRAADA